MSNALKMLMAGSAVSEPSDADFENTVLLLHGNGTNGAQNNLFYDSSDNNFSITRNGNTTQGTFSPFSKPDGRWGLRTNDRSFLTIPASSDFDLISTDYTIEFWFKLNAFNTMASSGNNFFGNGLATTLHGWGMGFGGSGTTVTQIQFFTWASGVRTNNYFTVSISNIMSEWCHIAIVRNGAGSGNLKCYVNGVAQGAAQNAGTYSTAGSTFTFGSGSYTQNGTYSGNADYYISNVRLTKSALYTSDFTPSTVPLTQLSGTVLLMAQSNRLINNGTNAGAISSSGYTGTRTQVTPFSPFPITTAYSTSVNGGSGYFDGSGDWLSCAGGGSIGSGAFTIRAWVYPTALASSYNHVFDTRPNNDASGFSWGVESDGQIFFYSVNAFRIQNAGAVGVVPLNAWSHISVTRDSSNNLRAYVNGVQVGSTVTGWTENYTQTTTLISKYWGGTDHWTGYIADAQMIAGVADSSVPTAPSTAVSGTTLLCNFTNAGILDNTGFNNLETVGNAQIDTSVKKYGTGSMEFDGTGDWLVVPADQKENFRFGTGDFTIEFWAWKSANGATGYDGVIAADDNGNASGGFAVELSSSAGFRFYSDGATRIQSNFNPNDSTWHHYAVVRSGNTLALYKNGTQLTTASFTGSLGVSPTLRIGSSATSANFNGFIDDLRITKGIARYTSNFTPQTAALPDIGE